MGLKVSHVEVRDPISAEPRGLIRALEAMRLSCRALVAAEEALEGTQWAGALDRAHCSHQERRNLESSAGKSRGARYCYPWALLLHERLPIRL